MVKLCPLGYTVEIRLKSSPILNKDDTYHGVGHVIDHSVDHFIDHSVDHYVDHFIDHSTNHVNNFEMDEMKNLHTKA